MVVDSLLETARRACCRYARRIEDIGDLPYEFVRPILLKIENPEQLYRLEQKCPQVVGEDGEVWLSMIKRDIPNWETKPHQPSNPKNWYKVYRKLKQDVQNEKAANEAKLKAALSSINTRKEENTAQVVSGRSLPKPTVSRRRQITHDYLSGRTGSPGAHKMSFLEKIRKEARDARSAKMSRPTHELVQRSSSVKKAPAGFVEDLRREKLARLPISPSKPAGRLPSNNPGPAAPGPATYDMTTDREARLRSLKSGKPLGSMTSPTSKTESANQGGLSTQFLEDDDLGDDSDDDDTLFGEIQKVKPASNTVSTPPRSLKRKAPPQLFMASHGSAKGIKR